MASKMMGFDPSPGLTVIVPFRNEEATLYRALERLLAVDFDFEVEVIAVDDGSTDRSVDSIRGLLHDARIKLVRLPGGRGKGHAVRAGLAVSRGWLVAILDADLEYDARDLIPLVEAIRSEKTTVAYGSRPPDRESFYSFWYMVGGRATSLWATLLFGSPVRDMHTSLKVAPRSVWESLALERNGFDLDSEITAKFLRSGYRILEIPVSYKARTRAEGKKLRWTAGLKSILVITQIRMRKPLPEGIPDVAGDAPLAG